MWLRWLIALPLAAVAGCDCNGRGFPVDAPPDDKPPGGTFSLAWLVTDIAGAPILCDRVDGRTVEVRLSSPDSANVLTEPFTCKTLSGTSPVIDAGTYNLSFGLFADSDEPLATAPGVRISIESGRNTEVATPSAPIRFAVDDIGELILTLNTGVPGGNCASGAGITALTIKLFHFEDDNDPDDDPEKGGCEPVTFAITPSGGSYPVDCGSPQTATCPDIDTNQRWSVPLMRSGNYQIEVRGQVGAPTCWTNDDIFRVPPLRKSVTKELRLGKVAGCR